MDIKLILRSCITRFLGQFGWNSSFSLNINPLDENKVYRPLEAFIEIEKREITINYHPDILEMFSDYIHDYELNKCLETPLLLEENDNILKKNEDFTSYEYYMELYEFISGIAHHEIGHSRECPIDDERYSVIVQAISTAMEKKHREGTKTLAYLGNLFMDLIVDITNGLEQKNTFFRNFLFLHDTYELVEVQTSDMDLSFVYFMLIGSRFIQTNEKIQNKIDEFIINFVPTDYFKNLKHFIKILYDVDHDLSKKIIHRIPLSVDEQWKIINHLSEIDNWGTLAYNFSIKMLDFMKEESELPEDLPISNEYSNKLINDTKYQDQILEYIVSRKLEKNEDEEIQILQMKDGKNKKDDYDCVEHYPGENDMEKGIRLFEYSKYLHKIYEVRVKNLNLLYNFDQEKKEFCYGWLNKKIVQDRPNIRNLDYFNMFFIEKSGKTKKVGDEHELILYEKNLPNTTPYEGDTKSKSSPNFVFFCDDSGSMDWDPYTCSGKYDAVIILIYSLFAWLKEQSFSPFIKYNFNSFSSTTRSTGWVNYYEIEDYLDILFSPEHSSTEIDKEIFEEIVTDPKEKLLIILTDGEIFRNKKIKSLIMDHLKHTQFLLIEIGYKLSKFGISLKNNDYNVILIDPDELSELSDISINFLNTSYNSK